MSDDSDDWGADDTTEEKKEEPVPETKATNGRGQRNAEKK